jgi:hypothetical protein
MLLCFLWHNGNRTTAQIACNDPADRITDVKEQGTVRIDSVESARNQ